MPAPSDERIEEQLDLCKEATDPGTREVVAWLVEEVRRLRQRRCETCKFFTYADEVFWYVCDRGNTGDDFGPDWGCANWQAKEDANAE